MKLTKRTKGEIMDKTYHPISGEQVYLVTMDEKRIIDVALELLASQCNESPRSQECGVING